MSAKTTTSVANVVLTDKFKKELEKFFSWAQSTYSIKDIHGEEKEWSMSLLKKFEEPGRNKLEAYIKALLANYVIALNDNEESYIEDAKLLAKEFKDKADKKSEKSEKSEKTEKKSEKKSKKTEVKEEETKTETKKIKKTEQKEDMVKLDMSLDTSETYNVDTLEYWTEELVNVFGKPKKTGGDDDEHTWEWKIEVNGKVYTIYNWNENGESYDDSTWYLGSVEDNNQNVKALNTYIDSMLKSVSTTEKEEIEEVEESIEKEPTMEELFGDDSDDDLEIDLEGIDDE